MVIDILHLARLKRDIVVVENMCCIHYGANIEIFLKTLLIS